MTELNCGIYEIRNLINNKVYIGSSIHIETRWKEHLNDLKRNDHHSKYLQRSWNKYGEEFFNFTILEDVKDKSILNEREQWWIDNLKSAHKEFGYNMSPTAGTTRGYKHSDETKLLFSEIRKGENNTFFGRKHSKESKEKISNSKIGFKHSEESKKKMSDKRKGKSFSDEHKRKIGQANKTRVWKDESKEKLRQSNLGRKASENTKLILSKQKQGENNPKAKLTYDDAREIKLMLKQKIKHKDIAKKFNVDVQIIRRISCGQTWTHVAI